MNYKPNKDSINYTTGYLIHNKDISTLLKDSEKPNYEEGREAHWIMSMFPVKRDVSHC